MLPISHAGREYMPGGKSILIPVYRKDFLYGVLFVLAIAIAGCSKSVTLPDEGPEVVAKRFYEYISEAKLRGMTPARAAYKMIDTKLSNLEENQFLQIIKRYPPGFMVDVGKAKINGTQAVVDISYDMPSKFGVYRVKGKIPLNVDQETLTWKVDFTGDTYGKTKSEFMQNQQKNPQ